MKRSLMKLLASQRGATAVEYGLILSMVVLAMLAALAQLASTTTGLWNSIATKVSDSSSRN